MSSTANQNNTSDQPIDWEKKSSMRRLTKRLAYLLRYGASKEGLEVDDNGYVELKTLCRTRLLQKYSETEVLEAVKLSTSYKHTKRYDYKEGRNGQIYVRAAYLRNFEKSPYHKGTKVKTLFEFSMSCVLDNIDDFDLEDFPDEHTLRTMMRRLKQENKLNYKALRVLLAPTITHLDLEGVYLTNSILRLVWTQCPNLRAVSLRNCGYIITDTILTQFTKNLPCLEKMNLCLCTHLTNKSLTTLAKNLPQLHTLHITRVPSLTSKAVLDFLHKAAALKFLDVYYLPTTPEEYDLLVETARTKTIKLVLRGPGSCQEEVTRGDYLDCFFKEEEEGGDVSDDSSDTENITTDDDDDENDDDDDENDEKVEVVEEEPSSDEDDKILLDGLLNEIWSDQEEDEL